MGTTLTGTTPQDTYDSLIKVTDNGPLSGSLKKLTDGLGNDSSLSLSTTAASFSGTLAVTGALSGTSYGFTSGAATLGTINSTNAAGSANVYQQSGTAVGWIGNGSSSLIGGATTDFGINSQDTLFFAIGGFERMRVGSTGNVGIGTSAPQQKLHVAGVADSSYGLLTTATNWANNIFTGVKIGSTGDTYSLGCDLRANTNYGASPTTTLGIWVSNAASTMVEVVRATPNGLTFNGDTAAANALDDYEEGTWTMGVSFGGASVGVTTANNTGSYTKIGRQVTVNGVLTLTSKGSSTGVLSVTGLPFTIGNTNSNYSSASLRFFNITFANQFQGYGERNSTRIDVEEITELGAVTRLTNADVANDSEIMVSLTYFV